MPPLKGLRFRSIEQSSASQSGYDACVIGAGAAGSYVASSLAARGMRVALCEAGGARCMPTVSDCFDAAFTESIYSGASDGRAFGFGGSTSRWGALLIPHSETDSRSATTESSAWNLIVDEVRRRSPRVLERVGWRGTTSFDDLWLRPKQLSQLIQGESSGLLPMEALYLPFRLKNLAWLFEKGTDRGSIDVFAGAIASRWIIRPASTLRINAVELRSPEGRSATIHADRFIVGAGALESTRLILDLAESIPKGVLPGEAWIGKSLGDHLSLSIGDFEGDDLEEAKRVFAPRFEYGWMRGTRLLLARDSGEPRGFIHPIFDDRSAAFLVAKECLQALQARRLPNVGLKSAASALLGTMRLTYRRFVHRRLHLDSNARAHLQLDLEQAPCEENRIDLAPISSGVDSIGRRRLQIRWAIRPIDLNRISAARDTALHAWSRTSGLPQLKPRAIDLSATKPHDAYHPVGTLRLGEDPSSVVDPTLALRGVENIWVVSTAVFPSAGTANPTFSMLCLAEGLCERLSGAGMH